MTEAASFSHFGINVTDLEKMVSFYTRVLGLVVDQILAETEAICRKRPGFASRSAWRDTVTTKMAAT